MTRPGEGIRGQDRPPNLRLGPGRRGINGQAASGAAGEFGLPPLLTAMFSDFLGREQALPFQTRATEVDEQGDSRVAAGCAVIRAVAAISLITFTLEEILAVVSIAIVGRD